MATTADTQTRTVGDTLRLSGYLAGNTLPTDAASWSGATAVINIVHATLLTDYRLAGAVALTFSDGLASYSYQGTPPVVGDIGSYLYAIVVTFADASITSFPNGESQFALDIVAALG